MEKSHTNSNKSMDIMSAHWRQNFCLSNAHDLLYPYENQIKKNDRFLDVGCGDGMVTAWLSKKVPLGYVLGIDILESAINIAKSKYIQYDNLNFKGADACNLDILEKFNWVVSFNSLHWIDEIRQLSFLKRATELISENGKFLFTFGLRHEPICSIIDQVISGKKWFSYFENFLNQRIFFTPDSYSKLLEKANLYTYSLKTNYKTYTFSTKNEFEFFVISWLPQVNHIPCELRQTFIQEISSNYIKACPTKTNSTVEITFSNLEVEIIPNSF